MASRIITLLLTFQSAVASEVPIVDLSYAVYQGSVQEGSSYLYNFSNIRYGEPPIGDLRFAKPIAPKGRNGTIDKGDVGRICPQAMAAWEVYTAFTGPDFLSGKISALTEDQKHALKEPSELKIPIDPRETEDCLFLDVVTPIETFENPVKKLAPVIFWLSGGGYTTGEKGWFDPAGLIKASYVSSPEGLVFVSANYRLGALGWLAGSKLDPETMVANAALYDQRLALEWIQDNIHQFGGDPTRVTIMGESAGGASIYHHLTAFGGKDEAKLFQRAIPQSTGWVHIANEKLENDVIDKFLALAMVTDLEAAKKLSTEEVQKANRLLISNSAWGTSTMGPFVDGLYVPENPDKLFAEGRHIQNVDLLIGFNEDEGLIFTSPESNDDAGYRRFLESTYSNASPETLDHIETTLYPPVFDGSYGYTNQTGRASVTKAESEFTCKYGFLQAAYGNRAKSYRFNVYPGLHGSEMHYTFYNGPDRNPEVDEGTAVGFQELLTSFAATGNATSLAAPQGVPVYGEERRMLYIGNEGFGIAKDETVPARCKFWQSGIYL
ncbi:carboxylesterase type B [Fusarium pseudocircinatum]|uniref:Carboxylic ester hydrolase n=1 Tax=Fusarium pseudocircinatum TaxID=56676 RepID=A0A8H5PDV1_9HYPO|nr:carboxylesterase type B [Fusarium pseudocircinatum]